MAILMDSKSCLGLILIAILAIYTLGSIIVLGSVTPGIVGTALINGICLLIFKLPLPKIVVWILAIVFSLITLAICCAISEKGGIFLYIFLIILTIVSGYILEFYIWHKNIFTMTFILMTQR